MCDYPAGDLFSLGEHVGEFHSEKVAEDMDCNFCDVSFPSQDTKQEITMMKKQDKKNQIQHSLLETSANLHANIVNKILNSKVI